LVVPALLAATAMFALGRHGDGANASPVTGRLAEVPSVANPVR
jgi:hypothetical protein